MATTAPTRLWLGVYYSGGDGRPDRWHRLWAGASAELARLMDVDSGSYAMYEGAVAGRPLLRGDRGPLKAALGLTDVMAIHLAAVELATEPHAGG